MQLRYSWNEALDDVVVRQVNARSAPALQHHNTSKVFFTFLTTCMLCQSAQHCFPHNDQQRALEFDLLYAFICTAIAMS